jgi:hypothetical protein
MSKIIQIQEKKELQVINEKDQTNEGDLPKTLHGAFNRKISH